MRKCVLTDIASVVKTVEHFVHAKRPQVIPEQHERQGFGSEQVQILDNSICIIISADS